MEISPDKIQETLIALGYQLRDIGDSWSTSAVYRSGDNPTALTIYKKNGIWTDFVTGEKAQPFSKLVKLSSGENVSVSQDPDAPKIIPDSEKNQIERIFPNSILDRLLQHHKPFLDRGISIQVLKRLKAGLATSGAFYQRYTFPILNKDGNIVGFSGRDVSGNLGNGKVKWKHQGRKKNWIYPLFFKDEVGEAFVLDAIKKTGEVILVESIADTCWFHTLGVFNVICCFGLDISEAIKAKLIELAPNKVILAFNNDNLKPYNSGLNACANEFLGLLPYFDPETIGICLPLRNDFSDTPSSEYPAWQKKKLGLDYERQREYLCSMIREMPTNLKNKDEFFGSPENKGLLWVSKASYKNMKYLGC